MTYVGLLTPVLIALAGMYEAFRKQETPRWKKRLIPAFFLLTLLAGGYSVYTTYTAKKTLEPWEAVQVLYAHTVDAWALVNEADQTKDSVKLEKVMDEFTTLAQEAAKSRAPAWFKMRVELLGIAVDMWAIAERHPWSTPPEIMEAFSREKLQGTPFEGRPDKLLAMLGFFRVQDFGPPHRVLLGYGSDGSLETDASRLSKSFFLDRARDLYTDLTAMSQ